MMSDEFEEAAFVFNSSHTIPHSSFFFQFLSINLAAVVLRERLDELDAARILVEREARLDEVFDLLREFIGRRATFAKDDEGFGLYEAVAVVVADDRGFEHGFVLEKTVLDLRGRDEDAGDFQHLVRASVIPE